MPDDLMTELRNMIDDGAAPITLDELHGYAPHAAAVSKRVPRRSSWMVAGIAAAAAVVVIVAAFAIVRGSTPQVVAPRDTAAPPASVPGCTANDTVVPCELPGGLGIKETPTIDAATGEDALGSWQATMYRTSKAIELDIERNGDPGTMSGYGGGLPSDTPMSSGGSINGTSSGIVRSDITTVRITWPDGSTQDVTPIPVDQLGVGIYVLGRADKALPTRIIGLAADGSVIDTIP